MYGDFLKNLVLVFTNAAIDIVALIKVQRIRKQFRSGKRSEYYTKKETNFLKQTFGQTLFYVLGYVTYLMVPEISSNKYISFFVSLLSWCAIAMIDGMLTIVYNCEIRGKIFKPKAISVASTAVSTK
uniref:7TM_GPCR_Srx domain-containing protein n=1 Tax=Caenorhabditis japonica TaxID=281687 RepID=A0A8R1DTL3_CAEJA